MAERVTKQRRRSRSRVQPCGVSNKFQNSLQGWSDIIMDKSDVALDVNKTISSVADMVKNDNAKKITAMSVVMLLRGMGEDEIANQIAKKYNLKVN